MQLSTLQAKMQWASDLAAEKGYVYSPSAVIYPDHFGVSIDLSVNGKYEGCPRLYLNTMYPEDMEEGEGPEEWFLRKYNAFFQSLPSVEETEQERKKARLASLLQELKDLALPSEQETAITSAMASAMTVLSSNILPRSF